VHILVGDDRTTVYVKAWTKTPPGTLALLDQSAAPALRSATFTSVNFEGSIANQEYPAGAIANKTYNRLLYGH
jgi:hypothetical protein